MLDWLIQNRNKATTVRNRYPDEYQTIMCRGAKTFQENLYRHIHGVTGKGWEVFSWETGYTNPYEGFPWWEKALIFTNDDYRLMKIVGHWKVMSYSKDNKDIYSLPESENGRSFVTCPVLGFRMRMITSRYMKNILGMTVEEFDARYPETTKICQSRRDNISAGLNAVDESGLTKHAKSTVSRKKTMTAVGEDGLTKYQKLGKKTRATHMAKKDENGMNGYQRLAKHRNETVVRDGKTVQQLSLEKRAKTIASGAGSAGTGGASKKSKQALKPILDWLDGMKIQYYFDKDEYAICHEGTFFKFDLVVPSMFFCLEYQSRAYHPSIYLTNDKWKEWRMPFNTEVTADEKAEYDYMKAQILYEERGYRTWFVWEDNQREDVQYALDYLKSLGGKNVICGKQPISGIDKRRV